ncbi:unnamed protein product [Rangifer tarandus platyrhynchus]|uniref:Uncharacterized protein n=1 Tax=Rangifer tarandus platyrhynchus TaxID=3082113 RepID=A0AC60A0A8_RANTA
MPPPPGTWCLCPANWPLPVRYKIIFILTGQSQQSPSRVTCPFPKSKDTCPSSKSNLSGLRHPLQHPKPFKLLFMHLFLGKTSTPSCTTILLNMDRFLTNTCPHRSCPLQALEPSKHTGHLIVHGKPRHSS